MLEKLLLKLLIKSSLVTGSPLCQDLLRMRQVKSTSGLLDERDEQQEGTL